jgi:branched-chain amino acid transport system substrate-binding protein
MDRNPQTEGAKATGSGATPAQERGMVRKLVESDKVFLSWHADQRGVPQKPERVNENRVPQLFVTSGASKCGNPKEYPWTMGLVPDYLTEGAI